MKNTIKKSMAEAMGTFAIVFFGCGSVMVAERFSVPYISSFVPIIFGLIVAVMVYAIGHISGAHFNPAVTLAFALARHFPRRDILPYWVAQFVGGILAMGFLYLLLPNGNNFGETLPQVTSMQALGWETILTFFLMFVVISVATDTRAIGIMAGAAIGATVTICAVVGGPITGASMNPVRSFAPALVQGHFNELWIYFIGPFVGATLAVYCYKWIRCLEDQR